MDLSAINPHSREIEIKNPATGKGTGFFLEIVSEHDDRVKAVDRGLQNKVLRSRTRALDADSLHDAVTERLVASVVGWRWTGDARWGAEGKLEFTPANVRKVLANPAVRKQIEEELADDAAFFAS